MAKKKQDKMIKPRHKIIEGFLNPIFGLYARIAYKFKEKKFDVPKGPGLYLCNHVTTCDPAFVAYAIRKPVYFVGMEDIVSRKGLGPFLKWAFNVIPKAKAQSDPRAVKMIIRTIKEGGRVLLFPSGNRTYDSGPCFIDPSIAKLCKILDAPIYIINIIGGYGCDPRWGYKKRKGKVSLVIRDTITQEELKNIDQDALYERIVNNIDEVVDDKTLFKSNRKAEYLERLLFVCPDCNSLNTLSSHKNTFKCSNCGYEVEYQEDLTFKLLNGNKYLKDVKEWLTYIKNYVSELDFTKESLLFEEKNVGLYKIYPSKSKEKYLMNATFKCFNNRIEVSNEKDSFTIPFDTATNVCAVGKHKANFIVDEQIYQIDGDERCNAFKYVMMYYHYQNTQNNTTGPNEYYGI